MFDATMTDPSAAFSQSLDPTLQSAFVPGLAQVPEAALELAHTQLTNFFSEPDFLDVLRIPFGDFDEAQATALAQDFITGDFSNLPTIEILPANSLLGAKGGFDSLTGTIYLSSSLVTGDSLNPQIIADVLLEEYGHFIDSQINNDDSPGDEGAIFAKVVQGQILGEEEILALQAEDDSTTLALDDQVFSIEMSQIAMAALNGRLYQTHRGTDNAIYINFSSDGTNWSSWQRLPHNAMTPSAPSIEAFNNRIYVSHRGLDNAIYTSSSSDGVTWTNWVQAGGTTPSTPALEAFNGRLYQSHRGMDNQIYTRSSTNGINWTNWVQSGGVTPSAPDLEAYNGRLYQSHRGMDNQIYTRSSTDGVNWTNWTQAGGVTPSAPSLEAFNGRLYQSHRGMDNKIYTRSSTNGTTWTAWTQSGGDTPSAPDLGTFGTRLYQTHQGLGSQIFSRSSTDGMNWTGWREVGGRTPIDEDEANGHVTVNGVPYTWNLSRYDANGRTNNFQIDPNKQTILVAHGRVNDATHSVENLQQLARTSASIFGNSQILFLDWRNASADTSTPPYSAGKRIGTIANSVYQGLRNLGLTQPNNLHFYGHSLGSLLLTKVAERYGRIAEFASLDPAFPAEDYDLDNDGNTWEDELPDLRSIANRSVSLVAEDNPVLGAAGDNNYAMTAHRAYIVDFKGSIGPTSNNAARLHSAVVGVFRGMLRSGLDVNTLATDPIIRNDQWGQDGSQKQSWFFFGNYDADGVIRVNVNNELTVFNVYDLLFVNNNTGQANSRIINQTVTV